LKSSDGDHEIPGIFIQRFNYGWHICEALNKYPEKMDSQQTWNELGKTGNQVG
jgi:hypothetical protein